MKDNALLHIAAAVVPGVEGERLLGYALPFDSKEVLGILRRDEPGRQSGDAPEGEVKDGSPVDSRRSEELIRMVKNGGAGWAGLEETVRENVKHLKGK